jgi:hypothetical protein
MGSHEHRSRWAGRSRTAILSWFLLPAGLQGTAAAAQPHPGPSGSVLPTAAVAAPIAHQLHDLFFLRTDASGARYGEDALDPLLWRETVYLLRGPSHVRALRLLDEFLRTRAENQIRDPVERALLQRDLWAVFDWSAMRRPDLLRERQELQVRLAEVLRRLAVSAAEIRVLPDNYAEAVAAGVFAREYDPAHRERPFLPPDLFQPRGAWVCIRGDDGPVAADHVGGFAGRSRFLVFVRLPGGRKATLEYFGRLWDLAQPWATNQLDAGRGRLNPDLPQFPVGTEVALVRQMLLFDREGTLVAAPLTENIQIRVYRTITARIDRNDVGIDWPAARQEQDFYELRLSEARLVARQAGGLRAVARDEREFSIFSSQGNDVFELSLKRHAPPVNRGTVLDGCAACHSAPGINSLQSRRQLLRPHLRQSDTDPPYDALWWDTENTITWKANRYEWGLLNGYWQAAQRSP